MRLSLHIQKKIKVVDDSVLLIMYPWHEQIILEHSVRVYEGMDPLISEKEAESMEKGQMTTVRFQDRKCHSPNHVNSFQHLERRGEVLPKKYQGKFSSTDSLILTSETQSDFWPLGLQL